MAFQNRIANHRIAANICQAIMCPVVKKPGARRRFPPRPSVSTGMAHLPEGWQKLQCATQMHKHPKQERHDWSANPQRIPLR